MKKFWFAWGIVLIIAAAVFFGRPLLIKEDNEESGSRTVSVVRRDIGSSVLATGIVKPVVGAEVKVGSRVSGVVRHLRAQIGDFVEAGQIIAELDDAELKAKLNQNMAALKRAEADLEYAGIHLMRQRTLLKENITSVQEVDLAENAKKIAMAQVEQATANVEFARVQLGYARIFAPISGVIASISTQEGETVAASLATPTFVNLIDLERLEVQTFVDETDIGRIRIGLETVFTVDTYPDTDFMGTVTAIYPKAVIQDNVVNYIVTVGVKNVEDRILRPEMTANVSIILETRKNVLSIPTSAITREAGQRHVTVLEDGNPVRRKIKIGWKYGGYTEIISGLKEGDQVVVSE